MDSDHSNVIRRDELFSYFGIKNTKCNRKIFTINRRGVPKTHYNFLEFVIILWNFLTINQHDIPLFIYSLFHIDHERQTSLHELNELTNNLHHNDINDKKINLSRILSFRNYNNKIPVIVENKINRKRRISPILCHNSITVSHSSSTEHEPPLTQHNTTNKKHITTSVNDNNKITVSSSTNNNTTNNSKSGNDNSYFDDIANVHNKLIHPVVVLQQELRQSMINVRFWSLMAKERARKDLTYYDVTNFTIIETQLAQIQFDFDYALQAIVNKGITAAEKDNIGHENNPIPIGSTKGSTKGSCKVNKENDKVIKKESSTKDICKGTQLPVQTSTSPMNDENNLPNIVETKVPDRKRRKSSLLFKPITIVKNN
jgi:hypothetical protein